jgi:hypothetical protein
VRQAQLRRGGHRLQDAEDERTGVSGFTDTLGLDEASTGADIVLQKSNNEVPQLIRAVNRLLRKQQTPLKKSAASQSTSKTDKRKTS